MPSSFSSHLRESGRAYRLHWIPLTLAYDLDNLFVPRLDASVTVEETEGEKHQRKYPLRTENTTPTSLLLRSINKIGKSAEVKHPKSDRSLPLNKADKSNTNQQEENQTRKVLQEE
ncbi:Uncharacterized protein Fot_20276 [Forsythia ovata]|uniref:Uncharacterized protein n=1 Tax=Forsythia ovata TaxID=205694 RepID=A0ABD1VNF9_9LAMI